MMGPRAGRRRARLCLLLLGAAALGFAGLRLAADSFEEPRRQMVEKQVRARGITQAEVLAAMEFVPRHLFVPDSQRGNAYADQGIQVGQGRVIYQPYVVALMTSLLELKKGAKVLEVGTGSGYQAAVLSRVAREVYSIEIEPAVASQAAKRLTVLGYHNISIRMGDGYQGWPERAPFDAILLSAAPPKVVPKPLLDQLRVGGKMVAPVGTVFQDLQVITKAADGLEKRVVIPVRLSPMKGQVRDDKTNR
jgi:protein-L-isoaspartate(D-aspartate) O-methyltransferase